MPEQKQNLWRSSAVLTAASLVGAAGNYAFQALMGRMLPLAEFGYLNAALSLAGMIMIVVTAASQAVTHHLARHHARDEQQHIADLKTASTAFLFRLTLASSLLAVVFIHPISIFFHVPRAAIAAWVLASILVGLWSALATAWCAGLARFQFLAVCSIASVAMRLATGGLGARVWQTAEIGLLASVTSAFVLVIAVGWRERRAFSVRGNISPLWQSDFIRFLVAALAVCAGNFAFTQSDALIAQRSLPGDTLGAYTAAGLFGRAVVMLPLPFLTVFFTARSGQDRSDKNTVAQLAAYTAFLVIGATVVAIGREHWCRLLLGKPEPIAINLMTKFAIVMIPVGLLQAVSSYLLAARKFAPCLAYGICALIYGAALTHFGRDARQLLTIIGTGATATLITVVTVGAGIRRRNIPGT
jgi:O-antigen/teichoic acid export membrane protein